MGCFKLIYNSVIVLTQNFLSVSMYKSMSFQAETNVVYMHRSRVSQSYSVPKDYGELSIFWLEAGCKPNVKAEAESIVYQIYPESLLLFVTPL